MKTPREILFKRHQAAEPKLDAIRQSAVAAVCDRRHSADRAVEQRSSRRGGTATMIWYVFWRELIFPSRRIWAGLAAIWILIFIVNFSQRDREELMAGKRPLPSPEAIRAWQQQQRLLVELIGPSETHTAQSPKLVPTQPRSERRFEILTT